MTQQSLSWHEYVVWIMQISRCVACNLGFAWEHWNLSVMVNLVVLESRWFHRVCESFGRCTYIVVIDCEQVLRRSSVHCGLRVSRVSLIVMWKYEGWSSPTWRSSNSRLASNQGKSVLVNLRSLLPDRVTTSIVSVGCMTIEHARERD